jgi:hypothetical protein
MALQVVQLAGLAEVSLVPVFYLEVFLAVSLVEEGRSQRGGQLKKIPL